MSLTPSKKHVAVVVAAATMPSGTSASEALSSCALVGFAALPPRLVVPVATAKDMVLSLAGSRASGRQPAHWLWPSVLISQHGSSR